MPSRWTAVDGLMRELGGLRNDVRAFNPVLVGDAVLAEADRLIADAAQAVDETITCPDSEALLTQACEAIVAVRQRIEELRATASRSRDIVGRSLELRDHSARLLYERIRDERKPG